MFVVVLVTMGLMGAPHRIPLACQPNDKQPMLPIFHIIGNVTMDPSGNNVSKLEPINDVSGVTYTANGIYHVWHQCCQNHWDHVISRDLVHWQRLPPPIQPVTTKTWDGSISLLETADGGSLILYDAQDGHVAHNDPTAPLDKPILGVARLADPNDKYLTKWVREPNNPVEFVGEPIAFPGQVWKNGDHWNMLGQGARFQSNDSTFHTWTRMSDMIGHGEHGGQWWVKVPNQINGMPPPSGPNDPNRLVNINGGATLLFGRYDPSNETFTPTQNTVAIPEPVSTYMVGIDLTGGDMSVTHHPATFGAKGCEAMCIDNAKCKAWTWVIRGSPRGSGDCCLKKVIPCPHPKASCTSGARFNTTVNCGGPKPSPNTIKQAHLEHGHGGWFGTQSANGRLMMIGWALPDYRGPAGIGIEFLTRLTLLREINYDSDTKNLVANPVPELKNLRERTIASIQGAVLAQTPMIIRGTAGGAASSADITITFNQAAPGTEFGACVLGSNATSGLGISITVRATDAVVVMGSCASLLRNNSAAQRKNLPLLSKDNDVVTLRITPDRSLADFFVQNGRVAGTVAWQDQLPRAPQDSAVSLFGTAGVTADITVYTMGCGWNFPSYTENPSL